MTQRHAGLAKEHQQVVAFCFKDTISPVLFHRVCHHQIIIALVFCQTDCVSANNPTNKTFENLVPSSSGWQRKQTITSSLWRKVCLQQKRSHLVVFVSGPASDSANFRPLLRIVHPWHMFPKPREIPFWKSQACHIAVVNSFLYLLFKGLAE